MNENYQIIRFCVEYAISHAFLPETKHKVVDALLWLENISKVDNGNSSINDEIIRDEDC